MKSGWRKFESVEARVVLSWGGTACVDVCVFEGGEWCWNGVVRVGCGSSGEMSWGCGGLDVGSIEVDWTEGCVDGVELSWSRVCGVGLHAGCGGHVSWSFDIVEVSWCSHDVGG